MIGPSVFLLILFTSIFVGGFFGWCLGVIVAYSPTLSGFVFSYMRNLKWLPYILGWSVLDAWGLATPDAISVWNYYLLASLLSTMAVALSVCYEYTSLLAVTSLSSRQLRSSITRHVIYQALLISLIFYVRIDPWSWFSTHTSHLIPYGHLVWLTLVLVMLPLSRLPSFRFEHTAELRASVIRKEVAERNLKNLLISFVFIIFGVLVWEVLSIQAYWPSVVSPKEALTALYDLLFRGRPVVHKTDFIWNDIAISLFECFSGLAVGGAIALLTYKLLDRIPHVRAAFLSYFPAFYVLPVVSTVLILEWTPVTRPWHTALGLSFLIIFPFMQILEGFKNLSHTSSKILFALYEAFPFAVVGMIFGEALNATAGLGFLIIALGATVKTKETIAVCFVTWTIFLCISAASRLACRQSLKENCRQ